MMKKIKNFLKKLQPKAKYILSILGIAAVVSQGAFAFTKLSATEPRFNFLEGDHELLRGANTTAGETVWKDPLSGNAGDTFQGIIYYHNGMVDTVAENTRIKLTIPASTVNGHANIAAQISADNASTITDTVVDGVIIGQSGLTVNLASDANLALVPGSVKWYPNQTDSPNVISPLPGGQTGNEIITASGINLGGVNGCWQYAGYVIFDFKTTPNTAPALDVDKTVRNVTAGETNFVEQTNASANDVVEFKIVSKNTGDETASDLVLKDTLPAGLAFQNGTMKIYRDGSSIPSSVSDANADLVFASGWTVGDLQAGNDKADIVTFEAKAPANIANEHVVTNVANIASGSLSDSDDAKVNLLPNTAPNIVRNKSAKNITTGAVSASEDVNGVPMKTLDAKPGDVIEYTLITKNTGNASANNYVIADGINDVLQESDFVSASNGGHVVDTALTGDDAKQIQYPAVNIAADEEVVRTFTVKVKDPLPNNPPSGDNYDHKLFNLYGDKVLVRISIPTPPPIVPILHIAKTVRNFTTNELSFVESNTAFAGDSLEYLITFSNSGNGPADQVKFSDLLPANTQYIPGTTILSMNGEAEHTLPDGIIGDGVMLDTIPAGENGYIKIRAIVAAGTGAGAVLTNTASITDNGVSISDVASTTIKAPVVLASTPLPRTGADSVAVAALSAILAAAAVVGYRKFA